MFIAVNPKGNNGVIKDRILIFDTTDLSCEYVPFNTVLDNLEYVGTTMHIRGSDIITGFEHNRYVPVTNALDTVLSRWGTGIFSNIDSISFKDNTYRLGEYYFNVSEVFRQSSITDIVIDNSYVTCIFDYSPHLHYAFKYKDYMILRFTDTTADPVITVILDQYSRIACMYSDDEFMYGDTALMTKIEFIFDY